MAPTSTITSVNYDSISGALTIVGNGFTQTELGVARATDGVLNDITSLIDFSKLTWNINDSNSTTTAVQFDPVTDISSVVIADNATLNANEIRITLNDPSLLSSVVGFGASGGNDSIEIQAGFLSDAVGNASSTDTLAELTLTSDAYLDSTAPRLVSITSSSLDGTYGFGSSILLTMTLDENVAPNTSLEATLNSGATSPVVFTSGNQIGNTLSATYIVGSGEDTDDLSVLSYTAGTVTDIVGNPISAAAEGTITNTKNLAYTSAKVIDTLNPSTSIDVSGGDTATFDVEASKLFLVGSGFADLDVDFGVELTGRSDIQIDWQDLIWDLDGDLNSDELVKVADFTFSSVVTSAKLLSDSRMEISFDSAALRAMPGFGEAGASDLIQISDVNGNDIHFLTDAAGNTADSLVTSGIPIDYSNYEPPSLISFDTINDQLDGLYGAETTSTIGLVASFDTPVQAGSFSVKLGDKTLQFSSTTTSDKFYGDYEITTESTENILDLNINSIVSGTSDVRGVYSGNLVSLSIPTGDNLADNAQVAIDTLDPDTTITRVTYNSSTGNIVLAGSDFIDLGHDLGTILSTQEELSQFDWASLTWKSGSQDRAFNISDIQNVTIAANNMTVNLKSETVDILSYDGELNAQSFGFAATDGIADQLQINSGFLADVAGNKSAQTQQVLAVNYSDSSGPSVESIKIIDSNGDTFASSSTTYIKASEIPLRIEVTLDEIVLATSEIAIELNTASDKSISATATGSELSNKLYADLTVEPGDDTLDLLAVEALEVALLTDVFGNTVSTQAVPIGNSIGQLNNVVIDTIPIEAPGNNSVTIGSLDWTDSDSGDTVAGDTFTLVFTEDVSNQDDIISNAAFVGGSAIFSDERTLTVHAPDILFVDGSSFTLSVSDLANNQQDDLIFTLVEL